MTDMAREKKYPIGIQNFETIITGGYLYVDKTSYVRDLVERGKYYFLGRPRRFGKSMILSTLQAFFEGRRELFKGLDIDKWDKWDWEPYPVIHIDLNAKDYTYKESLFEKIDFQLNNYEQQYNVTPPDTSLDGRFAAIIKKAFDVTGRNVVILIDEYDKPILDTSHDDTLKNMHRDTLRAFYSTIKSYDQYIEFAFLTGVTKFGQLGVFSGLNNLNDISIDDRYAGICGITEEELHRYFDDGIAECAVQWGCTKEDVYLRLKENYDGYHFSPSLLDVYNPWSVLNAVSKRFINNYWNQSGGGLSFLYKLLENGKVELNDLNNCEVSVGALQGTNVDIRDAIPVLYQAGYLTIAKYDPETMDFTLKYPNKEVETGFINGLLPAYSGMGESKSEFEIRGFIKDVNAGNAEGFLERMQAFFEDFPYENALKTERDFQNIMYAVTKMMGFRTDVEQHTARGRIDMTIETAEYVYVIEFKVNKSPEEALAQIEEKGYAAPYAKDPRELIRIGVEFSTEKRNITRWLIV